MTIGYAVLTSQLAGVGRRHSLRRVSPRDSTTTPAAILVRVARCTEYPPFGAEMVDLSVPSAGTRQHFMSHGPLQRAVRSLCSQLHH